MTSSADRAAREGPIGQSQGLPGAPRSDEVAADADRVIVIEGGRVTADGEPGEVIACYERAMGVTG